MTERTAVRARTVRGFCEAYGVGRSTAYELISEGRLVAVKAGNRTLIVEDSARAWFGGLPTHKSTHPRKPDLGGQKRTAVDGRRGKSL